jgi:hypothetical protein
MRNQPKVVLPTIFCCVTVDSIRSFVAPTLLLVHLPPNEFTIRLSQHLDTDNSIVSNIISQMNWL